MRRFRNLLSLFLLLAAATISNAQPENKANPKTYQRCATQEAIDRRYQTDPMFRAMMDQRERDFQRWLAAHPNGAGLSPETLTGPVTIPVVVHVVLPNPNLILESDVDYLISRLNLDFSGLNSDSTNGVSFYGVRGHSQIRWCLAKRDPAGNFTNGIERRVGAGTISGGEPQPIKSFGAGGLDPWDVTRYYNIWVGVGGGLLGISPEIGPGTATSDGVCINYQSFANNPCYTIGAFNLGRTAVHEIGHNFGLYHIFQNGCADADMSQLSSASCQLPAGVLSLTDDTPAQSAPTSGCPSGNTASGCASSPNPPGKQYQNYMDYTDDACYSMFSKTQVERMHWVLENCRAGYLTSNGCQLPAGTPALDAALNEIVSPGGGELVGCTYVTYNFSGCSGTFTPKVRVQNRGTTTLTSVTVQLTLNGTPLPAQTFAVVIPYGKSTVVTLNNATLAAGANTILFTVSAPNGGADGNAANNTINSNYSYTPATTVPLPVSHDFVANPPFLPAGWLLVNPNGNNTWVRNNNGNVTAGSAFIDNYNFNLVGQTDDIQTPVLSTGTQNDSVIIDFDYAHKNFPGFNDRLQVLVSSDCGTTFTLGTNPVFNNTGAALATAGTSTANYTVPAAGDWKHVRLAVYVGCGSAFYNGGIIVSFRNTNGYGNNIFIDNIAVSGKAVNIFLPPTITQPVCASAGGTIQINTNPGPVYEYSVNNGASWQASNIFTGLAPGTYNLLVRNQATPTCVYPYSGNPVTINNAPPLLTLPQTVDFVSVTFPPANLSINNPNGNNTWIRNNNGNTTAGSAFIDNYNFNLVGQIDEIRTVALARTGFHFISVGFDLAHKNFPGFNDRLQLLYSLDCGATWLPTAFDRSGATLATAGSSTANYSTPAAGDWVRQNVSINVCGVAGTDILIAWRATNGYGNNIFIDNISIDGQTVQVNQPANQAVCNGTSTAAITFAGSTAPSTVYNWTNNTPSIGLAASGTGNIPAFTAVNAGTAPVTATITVTPVSGSCTGTPKTFTITVNPTPNAVAAPSSQTVCSNTPISTIALTSGVSGTTYSWTRNNTVNVTGIAVSGNGNITGTPVNNTTTQQTVLFTITPSANGCTGTPVTATVIVNKEPAITCPANITVNNTPGSCGANVTYPAATATGSPAPVITYSQASGSFFPVGNTNVTATATNSCGTASCSFTVTVLDVQAPTITCPANITVNSTPGLCTATINLPNPTFADNCAVTKLTWSMTGATVASSPAAGINLAGTQTFNVGGTSAGFGITTVTYIATDAAGNTATCSFTVRVNDVQLPVINQQPVNQTVCAGTNATFSVAAVTSPNANGPLSYQWQAWNGSAWVNVSGATSNSFTVSNVTLAMNTNSYRVVITGLCTIVPSGAATLYVNPLPTVSIATSRPPQLLPGQTLNLTAVVSPTGGGYQWFKNGTAITGATGSSLSGLTVDDQGTYKVTYTDPNGCVSTSADLVVGATQSSQVFIYPNPNDGLFHIRYYNGSNETTVVSIFDAKGALAFRKVTATNNPYTDITVDLAGRNATGVYTVEVRGNGGHLIGSSQVLITNGQ